MLKLSSLSIFLCLICLPEKAGAESLVSEEILTRVSQGIHATSQSFELSPSPERKQIREAALGGLSDSEKIRALAEWMFRQGNQSSVADRAIQLLLSPDLEINDSTELRRLLKSETDSRRFYKLLVFTSYFTSKKGETFLAERARGLMMEGPAADSGQSTSGLPLDSIMAHSYLAIIGNPELKESRFVQEIAPKLEESLIPVRAAELARWLKANWPGCESLEVPKAISTRKPRSATLPGPRHPAARPEMELKAVPDPVEHPGIRVLWISGLVLLFLLVWKMARRPAHPKREQW